MLLWFILLGCVPLFILLGCVSLDTFVMLCSNGYFYWVLFLWLFVIGCHSLVNFAGCLSLVKFNVLCFWLILLDRVLLILLGRVWFSLMGYVSLFSIYKTFLNTEKLNLKWKEIKS